MLITVFDPIDGNGADVVEIISYVPVRRGSEWVPGAYVYLCSRTIVKVSLANIRIVDAGSIMDWPYCCRSLMRRTFSGE